MIKIAIPLKGNVDLRWVHSVYFNGYNLSYLEGTPIDVARDHAARNLEEEYSHIMFIDSDVILPQDGIKTLLEMDVPIASGIYVTKRYLPDLVWDVWDEQEKEFTVHEVGEEVFAADAVGAGCLLIKREVIEDLKNRYSLPLFYWSIGRRPETLEQMDIPSIMKGVSEDIWFCCLARRAGYKIMVNPAVKCKHIVSFPL
jgi:hypothetical protein